jgi:ribonuclease HII
MPWVVGIDEAGYGPNLGPLIQAAVGVCLPTEDPVGWETLKKIFRQAHEADDGRLLIDDSKKVYTRGGLEALERGIRVALQLDDATVGELLRKTVLPGVREELAGEAWYQPDDSVPVSTTIGAVSEATKSLALTGHPLGEPAPLAHAMIVPAPRFNRICAESGSKGAVLARGLVELLPVAFDHIPPGPEPVTFVCDKHGGRNFYAAMIQAAFPDGWVVVEKESAAESRYRVENLSRPVSVTFRPRADGESISVALASMLCKYLREVCMLQFNRFWAKHVPGITPTAGYPVDAKRFYAAIKPTMVKLGLSEEQVWRKK